MPWDKLSEVPGNVRTHNGIPLTLSQANFWGEIFDETNSAAIAWKAFEGKYKISGKRWVLIPKI